MRRPPALPPDILGDRPLAQAAKLMGLTAPEFQQLLPKLRERFFPGPDPLTGLFDLDAIIRWRKQRHPEVYGLERGISEALDARVVWAKRKAERAAEESTGQILRRRRGDG